MQTSAAETTSVPTRFRSDIQGLRAVAVVLVVVNHAFAWPTGGFVGVDVFYVISGFLITGILLREIDRTGTLSLRGFYLRRLRRIVPAALLVLVVTTVAAFLLWHTPRAVQTAVDALSAALFVSNWHFVALGSDYLQADAAVSPVQHYWSLSIEEQFYAVWPLLLLLAIVVLRSSRRVLLALVTVGIAASLAWAAWRTAADPTAAYFDTLGRAWELLVGALIAIVRPATRWSEQLRRWWARFGLALVLVSSILVGVDWAVPFPWVAPAVFGTALVIWAGAPAPAGTLLGNPVAQWLGAVSYSLYLWHLPVLIFATSIWGHSGWVGAACLPIMLVLSWWSRSQVEERVLRSRFLVDVPKPATSSGTSRRDLAVGVGALVLIAGLSLAQLRGPAIIRDGAAVVTTLGGVEHLTTESVAGSVGARQDQVRQAVAAADWPDGIADQLDLVHPSQQPPAMATTAEGCRNSVFQTAPPRICTAPAEGGILIAGDSVALSWTPTVQALGHAQGRPVGAVGFANCSLFDVSVTDRTGSPAFREACAARRIEMLRMITELRPAVVVLSASESVIEYTGLALEAALQEWQAGVKRTLAQLTEVPTVVILSNPPMSADPHGCATRFSGPDRCTTPISDAYLGKTAAEAAAARGSANVVTVDVAEWFCADGRCPAFVDGDLLRTDRSHLTEAAATAVGPLLAQAIG